MLNCEQFLDAIKPRRMQAGLRATCKMFQGGRRLSAGKGLRPRACSATISGRQCGTEYMVLGAGNEHARWSSNPSPKGSVMQLHRRRALSRLQLPDALSLRQTRLLHHAASRMQSCTLPGPALFRSARHLTCSVLSGVMLRRLLSSGNIVNWDKNYGSTERMKAQEQHPQDRAPAREKVRMRDLAAKFPASANQAWGCNAAAQAREHVYP